MKHTTETFIERAISIHGNKYDYSKVIYGNDRYESVTIICPIHGEYKQKPFQHLKRRKCNSGCPKCNLENKRNLLRLTQEEFIRRSKIAHSDKYDYSRVIYAGNDVSVIIGCPKHGWFHQTPCHHMVGEECKRCACEQSPEEIERTKKIFLEESTKIHNNKYDYSKVVYIKSNKRVIIICPKHGEFTQVPATHKSGGGCKKCAVDVVSQRLRSNTEDFINKAKQIRGDIYDLSLIHISEPTRPY